MVALVISRLPQLNGRPRLICRHLPTILGVIVILRPLSPSGGPFEAVKHNFGFHFWFNYILLCEQLSGFSRQVARARVSKPVRLKPQICINAVAMLTFAVFILFGLTTPEDFWKVGKNFGFWENTQVHWMITCLAFPLLSFIICQQKTSATNASGQKII